MKMERRAREESERRKFEEEEQKKLQVDYKETK